jgi:hypothetical protein
MYFRMWKVYLKIYKISKAISPFSTKEWTYATDNVQGMWDHLNEKDQHIFKFNMMEFDWSKYLIDQYRGIRFYLLNDDDSTLKISRIKYKR